MAELRIKHIRDSQAIEDYGFDRGLEQELKEETKQGIKKAEGKKSTQLETASEMLELEIPIEQIIKITGLTEEEIKNVR